VADLAFIVAGIVAFTLIGLFLRAIESLVRRAEERSAGR
jgi:hypothetical protein